ncbi:MAG TPA: hypothetical protein VE616_17130 [Candidatus Udaeobacter sp.]|nr:hypothetical protein [Candidatus Udaeobacter sp.]
MPPAILPIRWRRSWTGSSSRCAFRIPVGFHAKGMDGRIDDPKAGWKGKGIWSAYAGRATNHIEGGKRIKPKVVKFQLRPDPLAK